MADSLTPRDTAAAARHAAAATAAAAGASVATKPAAGASVSGSARTVGRASAGISRLAGARAPRIVIAGGGFAALEALLALRALLRSPAEVTVVAPDRRLAFRPAATVEAFSSKPPRGYDLAKIAAECGASFRRDRLEAVAPNRRKARLASFAALSYDALILAIGARTRVAIPGALTFRDQREVPQMKGLLADMRAGRARRVLFAVPAGCAWPLPLYELAMLTAHEARIRDLDAEILLASPSDAPLDLFGAEASRTVAGMLRDRGVQFVGGVVPVSVAGDGALELRSGASIAADRVVAAPQLRGPRLAGVPSGVDGFVSVDSKGRVEGLDGVYAAGDMTTFPVKHGGLAAQQADVIAAVIASDLDARRSEVHLPVRQLLLRPVQARLLGGSRPITLRAMLDAAGHPLPSRGTVADPEPRQESDSEPRQEKVEGRYLGSFLAGREPLTA